ncbi:MAG: WYL domain-containing protein, partial [Clostridiales bacterium]|nr:WYL domain-containing protein [Clostridiales bacterium]
PSISDSRGKADITKKTKAILYPIQQAILKRQRIQITYDNSIKKQKTVRKLDPYNLIFRESSWYVIGFCHLRNQVRMFKLMRIEHIGVIDESFYVPAGYSVQNYLRDTFTLIKGKEYVVEIQFFHPASVWVSEKQWLPSQKIMALKNDSIIFKARVDGLDEIKKWVLGYGKLAKVIKPQELVEKVVEEVNDVSELYGSNKAVDV